MICAASAPLAISNSPVTYFIVSESIRMIAFRLSGLRAMKNYWLPPCCFAVAAMIVSAMVACSRSF
jgi:hypothetical protein